MATLGRIFNLDLADLTDHARAVYDSAFVIPESGFRDTLLMIPDTNGEHQVPFRFPSDKGLRDAGSESDLALQLQDIRLDRIDNCGSSFSMPGPAIQTPAGM